MSETLQISTSAVVLTIEIICGLVSTAKIAFEFVELISIIKSRFIANDNKTNGSATIIIKSNLFTRPFTLILFSSFIICSILAFINSDYILKILSVVVFITVILVAIILTFLYGKLYRLYTAINTFITENQDKIDRADVAASLFFYKNYY